MATDPSTRYPHPLFKTGTQPAPGSSPRLSPERIHGEDSFVGSGKLERRVALVTGAVSGIGRAVTFAFAREFAHGLLSYLNEEEDAEAACAAVRGAGRQRRSPSLPCAGANSHRPGAERGTTWLGGGGWKGVRS